MTKEQFIDCLRRAEWDTERKFCAPFSLEERVGEAVVAAREDGVYLLEQAHEKGHALVTFGWGYTSGPGIEAVIDASDSTEQQLLSVARARKGARTRRSFANALASVG